MQMDRTGPQPSESSLSNQISAVAIVRVSGRTWTRSGCILAQTSVELRAADLPVGRRAGKGHYQGQGHGGGQCLFSRLSQPRRMGPLGLILWWAGLIGLAGRSGHPCRRVVQARAPARLPDWWLGHEFLAVSSAVCCAPSSAVSCMAWVRLASLMNGEMAWATWTRGGR
jgi:hypothetical protein